MYAPFLLLLFILVENLIAKRFKANRKNWCFYTYVLAFFVLYMGASCQIKVFDDLYPRYFFLVYLAVFSAILFFLNSLFRAFTISQKSLKISSWVVLLISAVAIVDMLIGFSLYRTKVSSQLYKIQYDSNVGVVVTEEYHNSDMTPSPIFKFAQLSPFDWGNLGDAMKYGYDPKSLGN